MKIRIPLLDIAAFGGGFCVGYYEGKGVDVRGDVEYIALYGPTAYAALSSPFVWVGALNVNRQIKTESRHRTISDVNRLDRVRFSYSASITEEEHRQFEQRGLLAEGLRLAEKLDNDYESLRKKNPIGSSVRSGFSVAGETTVGYMTGRLCSQLL
ncbi:MAG: hypothetical protein J4400_03980 [Candidatus Aenigmarchaeota archaeon]|nr:hypothetical protein [Candidatus Aenigmarchaeota archaeon]